MTPTAPRYPFPVELGAIPRDRSAVIEASAGTGKTYLIEHMVVDRLIRGDARLEEILVVTFTERAAAELTRRIRALVGRVLAEAPDPDAEPPGNAWTIDPPARRRLEDAERALDVAPISTIHAFCQRVLNEDAFASGRLLSQTHVESRTAFALAFAEVLRRQLSTDPDLSPYLEAWLHAGRSVGDLETLLYRARQLGCGWRTTFAPDRLSAAMDAFLALRLEDLEAALARDDIHHSTRKAMVDRLRALRVVGLALPLDRNGPVVVVALDELVDRFKSGFFDYLESNLAETASPPLLELRGRLAELAEAAVPLATAVAQKLGPLVEERLTARKRSAGHYDFDDMLRLVDEALAGPKGPDLIATLRRRFRLAIIDEFQDTDPVQWRIFRAIFHDSGATNPLYLIGDPKQSIYGFRGADVDTYAVACAEIGEASARLQLSRNFRSSREMIDAYNGILAHPEFFTTGTAYHPVEFGGEDVEDRVDPPPPIVLLRVVTEDEGKLPMRVVRAALVDAIADEIAELLAASAASDRPAAREIFVLTRLRSEAEAIARALAARDVPHVLYNQEGLYETREARHVRDLLRALADPHDRERRLRAWLTPFFALSLSDLPGAVAGAEQPLVDRLLAWHAAAETEDLGRLFGRILADSGVIRRELFLGESLRALVNYQHLFQILAAESARTQRPIGELARWLSARVAKIVVPAPEEGNTMRVEGDRDAVQIMTMHKAKGLEADVVFLYGGFGRGPVDKVAAFARDGRRVKLAGRPRLQTDAELIKRDRDGENQRLAYVALTRARRRLYLPFSGNVPEAEASLDGSEKEEYWKLTGGYRFVNHRLRALAGDRRLYACRDVPVTGAVTDTDGERHPARAAALAAWRPDPADLAEVAPDPELARLRRRRAGTTTTSYSRIKQAHGGYRPPTEILDEALADGAAAPAGPERGDDLPGGARSGIFLHDLLEKIPLPSLDETPELEAWAARPDVGALLDSLLRKHGRDPRHRDAAARLAHAALTTPLPVVGGVVPALPRARVVRELEFLFPFPAAAGGPDRGFVKGFVDVIFEHEGRTYFGDWKTDRLPRWDADAVAAHVDANYALQEQLYALALVRMLEITDEASYEARFGGTLYLFVRGLPGAVRSRRPSFVDLQRWGVELAGTLTDGATPRETP